MKIIKDQSTDNKISLEGNVGIGTSTPSENLHILAPTNDSSTIRLEESNGNFAALIGVQYNTNNLLNTGVAGSLCLRSLNAKGIGFSGTNSNLDMFIDGSGNVGIGTTTPSGKLHVQDPSTSVDTFITLKASGVRSAFMYYDRGATNAVSYSIYRTAGVDKWRTGLRPNSTDDFQIIRGASNTDVAMSISDNAAKLISGDFNDTSDVSLKNTIANHNYGVSKINEIQARSFKWNSDNRDAIGFIAQEVESVLPEAVSGEEGRKTIKVASILSVAVKAIQELSAELDAAKARIDTLESV